MSNEEDSSEENSSEENFDEKNSFLFYIYYLTIEEIII